MKKIIVIALFLIAVLASFLAFYILNRPSKALTEDEKNKALLQILGRKPNISDTTPKGNTLYKSSFVSFSYPAKAKVYYYKDPNVAKNASVLDTFSFDVYDPRQIFNYSVRQFDKISDISDIPDVKLREFADKGYTKESIYANGKSGLSFERVDKQGYSEKTAFFLIDSKSYSFSILGKDIKELRNLYKTVIGSLKFL